MTSLKRAFLPLWGSGLWDTWTSQLLGIRVLCPVRAVHVCHCPLTSRALALPISPQTFGKRGESKSRYTHRHLRERLQKVFCSYTPKVKPQRSDSSCHLMEAQKTSHESLPFAPCLASSMSPAALSTTPLSAAALSASAPWAFPPFPLDHPCPPLGAPPQASSSAFPPVSPARCPVASLPSVRGPRTVGSRAAVLLSSSPPTSRSGPTPPPPPPSNPGQSPAPSS